MTSEHEGAEVEQRTQSKLMYILSQLRIKITLPYILLAIIVTFAAAFLVTRLLSSLLENRFQSTLLDAGRKAADSMVSLEEEHLEVWRSIAYIEGMDEAVAALDGEAIGLLATPPTINAQLDVLEVLDRKGDALFAMYHTPGGTATDYTFEPDSGHADWPSVQRVLDNATDSFGDKYADFVETERGWVFYTLGPIRYENRVVGVLLVGTSLDHLVARLDAAALARISLYLEAGAPQATTLAPQTPNILALDPATFQQYMERQAYQSPRRDFQVSGRTYAEVFGGLTVRLIDDAGLLSVALPLSFVTDSGGATRESLLTLFGLFTLIVVVVGVVTASAVVRRVQKLADATRQVAAGDLTTQVEIKGRDEVAALSADFNQMVNQLREGRLYRDLLGMTASPEVAAQLRDELEQGHLELGAQTITATILFADIRGFTTLSEGHEPAYIIDMLNEYFQGIVGIIRQHNGVVNKFIGDAVLAFFGVLPENKPPEQSAWDAVAAAQGMLDYVRTINHHRLSQGELPIRLGIGVNTGPVVAGILGSEVRFEYAILGDAVNVSQRLSDMNKLYPEYDLFVNGATWMLLGDTPPVEAIHLGDVEVKGRTEPVNTYAVRL
jgi:class 3 adenylate cyclase